MKLQRFFIEEKITEDTITLTDPVIINQLRNVFRKNNGDQVVLLDNTGFEFLAEISDLQKIQISFRILQKTKVKNVVKKQITLFCSLVKKDNFELIVEKTTELGINKIVPIISERSEKKDINSERLLKIIKEASEQSGRGVMPTLEPKMFLEETLKKFITEKNIDLITFHVDQNMADNSNSLAGSINTVPKANIGIFIGPEGGWTENEVLLFKKYGVKLASLGHQVLRAETAAVACVTLFLFSGQNK